MDMTFLRYPYSWYVDKVSFSVAEMESGCVAQAGCCHTRGLKCSSYLSLPSAGTTEVQAMLPHLARTVGLRVVSCISG